MSFRNFATKSLFCVALLSTACLAGAEQASCQVAGCSGTIVSKGRIHAFGISAAHCAEVGKSVPFRSGNRTGKATWVLVDASLDLAMFRIDTGLCLEFAAVGPSGQECKAYGLNGPKELERKRRGVIQETGSKKSFVRDEYSVKKGDFDNGDSGGGVFYAGRLCGVISHGDDDELFSATHDQILGFLSRSKDITIRASPKGANGWGDTDRTREIVDLKKRVAELERKINTVVPPPVIPGPDLTPIQKRLAAIERWITNFHAKIRVRVIPRKEQNDG